MMPEKTSPTAVHEINKRLEDERRKRDEEIVRLYRTGEWTYQELADHFKITKQRVEQIVNAR